MPKEYQVLIGDRVTFEGETKIMFNNNVGTFIVNESIFADRSNVSFSNLQTLKRMSLGKGSNVIGAFLSSLSSVIEFHWTINSFPLVIQRNFTKDLPKWISIVYDDSTVDKDLYREKLLNSIGIVIMKGNFSCYNMIKNVKFGGSYPPFGEGSDCLSVICDSSADGPVMMLKGIKDIPDEEDSQSGNQNGSKVSTGGITGIVIACALIVGLAAAGVVYYFQRIKIDRLKNEIPAENNEAYKSSREETNDTSSNDLPVNTTDDPFDDV